MPKAVWHWHLRLWFSWVIHIEGIMQTIVSSMVFVGSYYRFAPSSWFVIYFIHNVMNLYFELSSCLCTVVRISGLWLWGFWLGKSSKPSWDHLPFSGTRRFICWLVVVGPRNWNWEWIRQAVSFCQIRAKVNQYRPKNFVTIRYFWNSTAVPDLRFTTKYMNKVI